MSQNEVLTDDGTTRKQERDWYLKQSRCVAESNQSQSRGVCGIGSRGRFGQHSVVPVVDRLPLICVAEGIIGSAVASHIALARTHVPLAAQDCWGWQLVSSHI